MPADPKKDGGGSGTGSGDDGGSKNIDPIIVGLLNRLPKPGAEWPEAERTVWLDLLKGSFRLIYKDSSKPAK